MGGDMEDCKPIDVQIVLQGGGAKLAALVAAGRNTQGKGIHLHSAC